MLLYFFLLSRFSKLFSQISKCMNPNLTNLIFLYFLLNLPRTFLNHDEIDAAASAVSVFREGGRSWRRGSSGGDDEQVRALVWRRRRDDEHVWACSVEENNDELLWSGSGRRRTLVVVWLDLWCSVKDMIVTETLYVEENLQFISTISCLIFFLVSDPSWRVKKSDVLCLLVILLRSELERCWFPKAWKLVIWNWKMILRLILGMLVELMGRTHDHSHPHPQALCF